MNWEQKARLFRSALHGALGGAVDPSVRAALDRLAEPCGAGERLEPLEITFD